MDIESLIDELEAIENEIAENEQLMFNYFYGVAGYLDNNNYELEQRRKEIISILENN